MKEKWTFLSPRKLPKYTFFLLRNFAYRESIHFTKEFGGWFYWVEHYPFGWFLFVFWEKFHFLLFFFMNYFRIDKLLIFPNLFIKKYSSIKKVPFMNTRLNLEFWISIKYDLITWRKNYLLWPLGNIELICIVIHTRTLWYYVLVKWLPMEFLLR